MTTRAVSPNVESALRIISLLESGERRLVHDMRWDEYEQLLEELGDDYVVRISYAEGVLELMGPLYRHEKYKDFILRAVAILTKAFGLKLESGGSTTLKHKDLKRGAEPDTCFYIQHAAQMIGKETIDLKTDPPPDIVVEIDITSPPYGKLDIYAHLGVPEIWRYDGKAFRIFELSGGCYIERDKSVTFPSLSGRDMQSFIEQCDSEGQDAALDSVQDWVTKQNPT